MTSNADSGTDQARTDSPYPSSVRSWCSHAHRAAKGLENRYQERKVFSLSLLVLTKPSNVANIRRLSFRPTRLEYETVMSSPLPYKMCRVLLQGEVTLSEVRLVLQSLPCHERRAWKDFLCRLGTPPQNHPGLQNIHSMSFVFRSRREPWAGWLMYNCFRMHLNVHAGCTHAEYWVFGRFSTIAVTAR